MMRRQWPASPRRPARNARRWVSDPVGPALDDLRRHPATSAAEMAARMDAEPRRAAFWLYRLQAGGGAVQFYVGPGEDGTTAWRWWVPVSAGQLPPAATGTVHRLFNLAWAGNLRPHVEDRVHRGTWRILVRGASRDSPCGALRISAAKGTFRGGSLLWCVSTEETPYRTAGRIEADLRSWLAIEHGHRGREARHG